MKSRGFLFVIALAAVIVLFVAAGPVRRSAGEFLASTFGIVQRTFSPSEVYVGEIPLDKSADSANSNNTSANPMDRTGVSTAKLPAVSPKLPGSTSRTTADSKDKQISDMNDKINELQAKLNTASIATQATTQSVSSASTSTVAVQSQPQIQIQAQTNPQQSPISGPDPTGTGKVLISEIMAGADGNSNYEFVELYNAGSAPVDLTGWSVKKKSSTGSESSLVAAKNFLGEIIQPSRYFLLGNDGGYQGSVALDASWAHSNTLAYTNNSVVLYNGSGAKVEEIFWAEIPKGQSFARTGWENSRFTLSGSPTPQNSQGL